MTNRPRKRAWLLPSLCLLVASCVTASVTEDAAVCGPGYRPSELTGQGCVDLMGLPPSPGPAGVDLRQSRVASSDWLGSYTGSCGDLDCTFDLAKGEGDVVTALLRLPRGEEYRISGLRISGERGRARAEDGSVLTLVDLQLRDGTVYGKWTVEMVGPDGEASTETDIRFVVRPVG